MNKQIEALKMAIEALEEGFGTLECEGMLPHRYQETTQDCKEALAEAALNKMAENARELDLDYDERQAPVAWMEMKEDAGYTEITVWQEPISENSIPLYNYPATWQSLSDDEIDNIWSMNFEFGFRACARAIEQALKELNAKK